MGTQQSLRSWTTYSISAWAWTSRLTNYQIGSRSWVHLTQRQQIVRLICLGKDILSQPMMSHLSSRHSGTRRGRCQSPTVLSRRYKITGLRTTPQIKDLYEVVRASFLPLAHAISKIQDSCLRLLAPSGCESRGLIRRATSI